MLDLYTWPTPNGHKIHIMLEETGLDYTVHPVNILAGEQYNRAFLKISPNYKIPAIVDREGPDDQPFSLFESGAILIYLAEKTGRLLPNTPRHYYTTLQWLLFQVGDLGPMLGQAHHFLVYAPERIPYAMDRYRNEANRLYGVMDRRLGESLYLAGDEYTIADIATFPWVRSYENQEVDIAEYANVKRWFEEISARPAVQRGLEVLADQRKSGPLDKEGWENMFGANQYQRR